MERYNIKINWLGDDGKPRTLQTSMELPESGVERMVEDIMKFGHYYGEFDHIYGRVYIPPHRVLSVTVKRLPDEECTNAVENNGK